MEILSDILIWILKGVAAIAVVFIIVSCILAVINLIIVSPFLALFLLFLLLMEASFL